jgi:hypothetical protein
MGTTNDGKERRWKLELGFSHLSCTPTLYCKRDKAARQRGQQHMRRRTTEKDYLQFCNICRGALSLTDHSALLGVLNPTLHPQRKAAHSQLSTKLCKNEAEVAHSKFQLICFGFGVLSKEHALHFAKHFKVAVHKRCAGSGGCG